MDVAVDRGDEDAHRRMKQGLLRTSFCLMTLASFVLAVREIWTQGAVATTVTATAIGAIAWIWSQRRGAPLSALAVGLCVALVLLIAKAAWDLGGASGSALSFAFLPGLLAMLLLAPRWGISVTSLMLGVFAWLGASTPLLGLYDVLRFQDEIAMTLFAAGLGLALAQSLRSYEASIAKRKAVLLRAQDKTRVMTSTVYDVLEPLAARLVVAADAPPGSAPRDELAGIVDPMLDHLAASRAWAASDGTSWASADHDFLIRRRVMRIWLRIGAVFMCFVIARNYWVGTAVVPSFFSVAFCVGIDLWLGRPSSAKVTELVALVVGLLASGPLIAHIAKYGGTADAPALVITPSVVLFSALLSQGPATWVVVLVQIATLIWVAAGSAMTMTQSRLLFDLVVAFVVITVLLRQFFSLRRAYAHALLAQEVELLEAERRQRRLSGTLFHDVRNHLQSLILYAECDDDPELNEHLRSLARRIKNLITLSKELLLDGAPDPAPDLEIVDIHETLGHLTEAYAPRLNAKNLKFVIAPGPDLQVMALPELLVESVLGNLLSNAIKFSPHGAVIQLRAEEDDAFVRLTIRDHGSGIPPEVISVLGRDGAVPSRLGTQGAQGQGDGQQQ